jgi:hypothetical protein
MEVRLIGMPQIDVAAFLVVNIEASPEQGGQQAAGTDSRKPRHYTRTLNRIWTTSRSSGTASFSFRSPST